MKRASCAWLIVTALLVGVLPPSAAEVARMVPAASVYFDDKGAGLHLPEGVACGANGQFIVGDTGNDRLIRFTYQGKTVAGGSEIKLPQLSAPYRVHLDTKGDIYALDGRQRRIVHLSPAGEFKRVLAFDGVPSPSTVVPNGFAIDSTDSIYVLDAFSARVLVLNAQGRIQRTLTMPADAGFASDLTVDTVGTVYLVDSIKRRMYSAQKDVAEFSRLGGDLDGVLSTIPMSLTASKGTIVIAEGGGGTIVLFGRDGSFLSRQLKPGWEEGALNHPSQVCVNDSDEVFIADRDNSRLQVFRLVR